LAISIDGRLALPSGGKASIGGDGDRKILEESLAWSDAALIGGETLRSHQNTCLIHNPKLIKDRREQGKSDQPITIVVSRRNNFPKDWSFFHQPIRRWLLSPSIKNETKLYEREIKMSKHWSENMNELKKAGLSKLLLLGGASLAESIFQADEIDELLLTVCPKIIGGEKIWIPSRSNNLPISLRDPNAWNLKENKILDNNESVVRYFRNQSRN